MNPQDWRAAYLNQHWRPFRNTSDEDVPPYGIMRVTGAELRDDGETVKPVVVLTVAKPSTTFCILYLVNGPHYVKAGGYGDGTYLRDAGTVYVSTGTPAFGEMWGPQSDDWGIIKNRPGFLVQGQITDSPNLALAIQHPVLELFGKTDAAHLKNANGVISIYCGTAGSETDTGWNLTAYNDFANLAINKKAILRNIHGHWKLTSGDC